MSQFDEQLPEDLRDIAARLSAARVTPTALELDELRRRVHARGARPPRPRGLAGALRIKAVAGLLTAGLMLTTGAGVVLATGTFNGGSGGNGGVGNVWQTTSFHHERDASWCQYDTPKTYTYYVHAGHRIFTVLLTWDCGHLRVHIECGQPFGFHWGDGGWTDSGGGGGDWTSPDPNWPLTITTGGWTWTWTGTGGGTPPDQGGKQNQDVTVLFAANGGGGSMGAESAKQPTALAGDAYTRPGYTFAGWNTAPDGSGASYGDGALYPFAAGATLYAQWTADQTNSAPSTTTTTTTTTSSSSSGGKASNETVQFYANGAAAGNMSGETANSPTPLTPNGFSWPGYTFEGWSTSSTGGGIAYGDGANYSFSSSVTLYAQWTPNHRYTVSYEAHGGYGHMYSETDGAPTVLYGDQFSRPGYTFAGWNTSPTGNGASYSDRQLYPFNSGGVLYAMWTPVRNAKHRHHKRG
jgi:uncharacterized repeat protein (TIGR02543 family)